MMDELSTVWQFQLILEAIRDENNFKFYKDFPEQQQLRNLRRLVNNWLQQKKERQDAFQEKKGNSDSALPNTLPELKQNITDVQSKIIRASKHKHKVWLLGALLGEMQEWEDLKPAQVRDVLVDNSEGPYLQKSRA